MADQTLSTQIYAALLASIKDRIKGAQVRASGTKVIERLAKDLRSEFPWMQGFSRTNLLYMHAFSEAWPDEAFVQQVAGQLPWFHN
jgi:hypothetical protein